MNYLKKTLEFSAKFILKFPIPVFIFSCVMGLTSIYFASKIQMDPSLDRLLPENHKVLQILDEAKKIFGHKDIAIIVTRSRSLKEGEAFIKKSAEELAKHPEIVEVFYRAPIDFFHRNLFLYAEKDDIDEIYKRVKRKIDYEKAKGRVGLLIDDLDDGEEDPGLVYDDILDKYKSKVSLDFGGAETDFFHKKEKKGQKESHIFITTVQPRKAALDIGYSSDLMSDISRIMKQYQSDFPGIESVEFTGRYQKKPESIQSLIENFQRVTVISVLGVLLVLIVFFRSIRPIILLIIGLSYGILLTLGLTQIFIGTLNLISAFLVAILLGLGIDFGIHIILRYKEERDSGKSVDEAFTIMYTETCRASTIAVITTAIAFGMLMFSNFVGFFNFGLIGSIGVLCTLFSYMTLMSSVLIILTRYFNYPIILSRNKFPLPQKIWGNPKILGAGCILATLVAVIASLNVKFDYDFSKVLGNKYLPSYELDEEVNKIFNNSFEVPSVILANNAEDEKKIIEDLKKITDTKEEKKFISLAFGLSTILPENQGEKLFAIKKIKRLIQTNRKYINQIEAKYKQKLNEFEKLLNARKFTIKDLPGFVTKKFQPIKADATKRIILIYPSINTEDTSETIKFSDRLNAIKINGQPIKAASDSMIFAEILRLIQNEGVFILIITFLAIYLAVVFNFRSFYKGLIVFLPIAVGLIWMVGTQGLFNIKSDFVNVIAYPIVIGIGIDGCVHIYHRHAASKNLFTAIKNTGEAVTLSAATTLVAFGSLLLGTNQAIFGLGLLSVVGITMAYLSCMFVLPAILSIKKRS